MQNALYTYNKTEKIKSKKQLDTLFKDGKSFLVFPFKVVYNTIPNRNLGTINMGVGVSKKNYPHATDRNRIKRLMRESYRLNKQILHRALTNKNIDFFIIFIDKAMPLKRTNLDSKMIKVLEKLTNLYTNEVVA